MIYFFSLAWCLGLAWEYDVFGYTGNKWFWYYLLLIWFIGLSAFQYMIGSDIPEYMYFYQHNFTKLQFGDSYADSRQPGWILLNYCCRQITGNFVLLKTIQAVFVNVSVFSFFKRETRYVFLCITLYAITTYLIFNFNVLRQSFAIGFMLYYISYLKRKNYLKALFFLFMAFMFHNTALIGLILLLFNILKYNKKTIIILLVLSFVLVVFLIRLDVETLLLELIKSGYLEDGIQEKTMAYAESDKFEAREIGIGIGRFIQLLMIIMTVFYYTWKKRDLLFGGIGLIYLFFQILNYSVPIMFRFRQYFDMSFYVMFSYAIIEIATVYFKQIRHVFIASCLVVFLFYPVKEYLARYPGTPYRYFDQYYPYHSIFNPKVDYKKVNYFSTGVSQ